MTKRRPDDSRLSAARYAAEQALPPELRPDEDDEPVDRGQVSSDERAMAVEIAIQQAMRRGDFDDLPGRGKPLTGLGGRQDPDWWIRRKIEREQLTGLGPPALTLRAEDAALEERLDALHTEAQVRAVLEDFNRRVRQARLQLLGGPPVITRPKDVDAQVAAWRVRAEAARAARLRAAEEAREQERARLAAMTWRERRRERRRRA
ncbi:DnaJ family domain-containing protein [Amnibacterium sp.]|uniref:DnaJ family domain-containing protein n=1 Tax=Amnibacterium sp. TaxID=1872496 RepID=UPI003F7C62EB